MITEQIFALNSRDLNDKKSAGKIIILDDDVVIALRLQQRLTSMGFDIEEFQFYSYDIERL